MLKIETNYFSIINYRNQLSKLLLIKINSQFFHIYSNILSDTSYFFSQFLDNILLEFKQIVSRFLFLKQLACIYIFTIRMKQSKCYQSSDKVFNNTRILHGLII